MTTPLQELEKTYLTLQAQINQPGLAALAQVERDALAAQYAQARQNYWTCVNQLLKDSDPAIAALTEQIAEANLHLEETLHQLNQITLTLAAITQTVKLGTQLAAKLVAV